MSDFEGINAEVLEQLKQTDPDLFKEEEPPAKEPGAQEPEPEPEPPESGEKTPEEPEKPADGAAKKPEDKSVPLAALHEERERRKALQRQLDDVQRQMNQLAQLQIEQARQAAMRQKPEREPEPKDPLEELIDSKIQERFKPIERETSAMRQHQALEMRINSQEQAAKTAHPDYEEITEPVMKLLNYWRDQAERGDRVSQAKFHGFMTQPNPVEMAYMLGCAYKYMESRTGQQPQPGQQQPPQQKPPQPTPRMPRTEGMGGGGGGGGAQIDLENITSEEWAKLPQEVRNKLLMGIR